MKVSVPLVDEKVDLSNPTDAIMAIGLLVVGWAIFFMSQDIGANLKQTVNSVLGIGSEGKQQKQNSFDIL